MNSDALHAILESCIVWCDFKICKVVVHISYVVDMPALLLAGMGNVRVFD